MANSEQEQKKISEVAKMDWDDFEESLVTEENEGAMRKYFGDEEFEELHKLATQTRGMRQRAPTLGNVVLLPGIMGSFLVSVKNGVDEDLVWVNVLRLVKGDIERLRLSPDGGREADSNYLVRTSIVHKPTYARIVLKLRARWNVQPFAFDWRKDIDVSSNALADFIADKFKDEPVHLLAHSMGGLVSRNFIRLHKSLWEKMGDDNGTRGGRLIMLGTPNYGSFVIPQVLTGVEKLVLWLSRFDLSHNMMELLNIINTFVGSYQMLPAPSKMPEAIRDIYRRDIWGAFPVSKDHLERAINFHKGLEDEATVNPERMIYVAGCNRQTLSGFEIIEPGKFAYTTTFDGDGRVPFGLGLLKDVPTYYVEEDHGSLPKNDKVIAAVDQLLERGRTLILPDRPIPARAAFAEGAHWHRSVGEYLVGAEMEKIARHAESNTADADEIRMAEEMMIRAAIGENRPVTRTQEKQVQPVDRKPLRIEVVLGDITQIQAPVVVVGHYKGVTPIRAIGAIDKALGGWIRYATDHSMFGGELGQIFFIPVKDKQIAANSVLVAGMGEEGKFDRYDLRYLMLHITYAISALKLNQFASVMIGTGEGNLTIEQALRSTLLGISDAVDRLDNDKMQQVSKIMIIELDPDRRDEIFRTLDKIIEEGSAPNQKGRSSKYGKNKKSPQAEGPFANLYVKAIKRELLSKADHKKGEPARPYKDQKKDEFGPRITIERDGDIFRFSALTKNAVIPVRQVDIQHFFPEGISDRLMRSITREEQEMFGRLLHTTLIPEDFEQYYDGEEPLTLILDRGTASLPWEMACFRRPEGFAFFGTHLKLTRQFRTLLSSAPGITPKLNDKLRVLVIADPAPEPELRLPGARYEGYEVVRILNQIKQTSSLDIEVIGRIGAHECDPVEILALVLNEEFDIVHFAGHGIFDEQKPSHSGWVFGKDKDRPEGLRTLSAREIFCARQVPRLVFSNACFSAVVNKGKPLTAEEINRNLAGLAEAFFERGVQNYIGAGWPVQDDLAVQFATEFYTQALIGEPAKALSNDSPSANKISNSRKNDFEPSTLGDAVSKARELILNNGSTWGAYHHYGHGNDRLMKKKEDTSGSKGTPTTKPKKTIKTKRKTKSSSKRKK
ncbi:MAG TPA: CHAT domain-containing protein [Thermodesulfobacteriota bacterium]|nr:CHAT domain-containing protein [Thermodesulfobacteriota bacterium]